MNTDVAFSIGSTHEICQDYATNLGTVNDHHVIVCDGCSSSPMTDVGARLLALTASFILSEEGEYLRESFGADVVRLIKHKYAYELKMNPSMFDATLLVAQCCDDEVNIFMAGDGMVVAKKKNGEYNTILRNYPSGYPRYLAYDLSSERKKEYAKVAGFVNEEHILDKLENIGSYLGLTVGQEALDSVMFYSMKAEDLEWVAIFSDGIGSFVDKTTKEKISEYTIIKELLQFKTFTGRFAQRRLNKFEKDCNALNYEHYDDLSMGVIYLG